MRLVALATFSALAASALAVNLGWSGFGGNARHNSKSPVRGQPLQNIWWSSKVDLRPQYSGDDLLIHYGTPCITPSNTVIIPVKTTANDFFRIEARSGADGSLVWSASTKYSVPPHRWFPSYGPVIVPASTTGGPLRLAFAESGGRIRVRNDADAPAGIYQTYAFYGRDAYLANPAAYDTNLKICTPLTSGADGSVYFGFTVLGETPIGHQSGIAKIRADGTGLYVAAAVASKDSNLTSVKQNCAPAISNGGSLLYVTVNEAGGGRGKLLALSTATLKTRYSVDLVDPQSGNPAFVDEDGTSSPMVGSDGDVYYGVLENPFGGHHYRGWMLHFSNDLAVEKTPGSFGWDNTPSVVPATSVPFYTGASAYLILTKYNNYAGAGDGQNRMALLDPNETQTDPFSGIDTMKEIATQLGPTPDEEYVDQGFPNAVREWCVNTAAVDVLGKAVYMNNEDGILYRWDLATNSLSQSIRLTIGIGEAYTPTLIGPDGRVYAINNARLFSVGRQ